MFLCVWLNRLLVWIAKDIYPTHWMCWIILMVDTNRELPTKKLNMLNRILISDSEQYETR